MHVSTADETLLPVIVTALLGILGTLIGYYVGRQAKIDEIRLRRGYELAERISAALEKAHTQYANEHILYDQNYGHMDGPAQAAESFHKYPMLSEPERDRIRQLMETRDELSQLLLGARVFLNPKHVVLVGEYLKSGDFIFMSDGGVFSDTYMEEYYRSLSDEKKHAYRVQLYDQFMANIRKIVK